MSKRASQRIGKSNPFYGKHHSDDAKEKIRQKRLGTTPSQETIEKIRNTKLNKSQDRSGSIRWNKKKNITKTYWWKVFRRKKNGNK